MALSACAARGPDTIVSSSGPTAAVGGGTVGLFADAYEKSLKAAPDSDLAFKMVSAGTQLQYQLCYDFFKNAGKEQQWLLFSKDFLATAGTIIAGVLGASGGSGSAIAWVGLSAGAGVSAINIYERNFLFSEDNVKAVQDLAMKAVDAARQEVLSDSRRNSYDFASGVSALMDVQQVCEVQNILALVRKSISSADPVAKTKDFVNSFVPDYVKANLGQFLQNGPAVTDDQLTALYWLYAATKTAPDKKQIALLLRGLAVSPLNDDGTDNPTFGERATRVKGALAGLPASVKDQLEAAIKTLAAGGSSPTQGIQGGARRFSGPVTTMGRPPGRVTVDIR